MTSATATDPIDPPIAASNRIVFDSCSCTWADLLARTGTSPRPADVLAFLVDTNVEAALAVAAHLRSGGEMLLTAASRIDLPAEEELRRDGFDVLRSGSLYPASASRPPAPGRIWLLTSASTGRPKRVAHTLGSLATVPSPQPPRRWLCPYSPGTYAWWQVVTLSLTVPGQEVVFVEPADLDRWPQRATASGVTAVSGTPTFWRHALWRYGAELGVLALGQVTLGGEPVDQQILDRLRTLFPHARISWIYASSEAGATIAVHDGRAGFPVAWLDRDDPGRPRLRVADGELLLDSPWPAVGMSGTIRTGDRVEVNGDRVHIVGRLSADEINVGGAKASAAGVRNVLLEHPEVSWAAVRGRRAPLVGQVVVADVVTSGPVDRTALIRWCAERLPDHAVPRRLNVLDGVPLVETLKSRV